MAGERLKQSTRHGERDQGLTKLPRLRSGLPRGLRWAQSSGDLDNSQVRAKHRNPWTIVGMNWFTEAWESVSAVSAGWGRRQHDSHCRGFAANEDKEPSKGSWRPSHGWMAATWDSAQPPTPPHARKSSRWTNGATPLPSSPLPLREQRNISLLASRTQCPDFPRGSSFWNYSLTLYYSAGCWMTDWKQSSKIYFSDLKFSWNL